MRKVAITPPTFWRDYAGSIGRAAKPNNFVISPMLIFGGPTLIARFCDDPSRWTGLKDGLEYISVEDGRTFRICKPDEEELLISTPAEENSRNPCPHVIAVQPRPQVLDFAHVFITKRNLNGLARFSNLLRANTCSAAGQVINGFDYEALVGLKRQ